MARLWLVSGALLGLAAVALAAWTAHGAGLEGARLRQAEAAVQLQAWHALALLAVGLLAERRPGARLPHLAGGAFLLGAVLFPAGVWSLALTGTSPGPLAPLGGVSLMAGWLLLALAALRR